jgi:hypothetical protein
MIKLSEKALHSISESQELKINIQSALKISSNTLYKYRRENNVILSSAIVLDLLRTETGLTDNDLLTRIS